jgi:hypothetical protein
VILGSPRSLWSVRVYTIVLASSLIVTSAMATPLRVTVEPTMTKGPATAHVTIIEFSDYQ